MNVSLNNPQSLHPLSSVQREIWFAQTRHPNMPVYTIGVHILINGPIDAQLARQALTLLVRETDILRVTLTMQDGVPMQSFPEMPKVDLRFEDLSSFEDPEQAAYSSMERAINSPFRLLEEPLFRFALFKVSDERYLWLQTYHLLVIDEPGIAVLSERVALIYTALLRGESIPSPSSGSYLAIAEADTTYSNSDTFDRHREYWLQHFSPLPKQLFFRKVGHASRTDAVSGAVFTWLIPRAKFDLLSTLAKSCEVSVFEALLGLLYAYFIRVQDQDELVIGVSDSRAYSARTEKVIGPFAGEIPIRFGFGREITFSGLLRALASRLSEINPFKHFPSYEIHRTSGAFQAGLNRLNDLSLAFVKHAAPPAFGDCSSRRLSVLRNGSCQIPLAVTVREYSEVEDIEVDFSYNLAYFDAAEIERMQGRFKGLLDSALEHPDRLLGDLQILPPEEERQILVDWNATATALPVKCIHQVFEERASDIPNATAVVFEDETLTYGEVNNRANQLSHKLISLGIAADIPVAIAMERSSAMIVALMAVLKAGGAYVPLDPDYPTDRLAFMLKDSGARILLTQESLRRRIESILSVSAPKLDYTPAGTQILCLDSDWSSIAEQLETNPELPSNFGDLAYIIYTSGSTGKPKGAMNTHGAISNRLHWMQSVFPLDGTDHILQKTPSSFDVSVWEFFWPLMTGARLIFARPGGHRDNAYLIELICKEQVTTVHFVPPMLQAFLETPQVSLCTTLRRVICSGQELLARTASRFYEIFPSCELHNLYGPTEAAVDVSWFPCSQGMMRRSSIPVGRPIANTALYILDAHIQPVPIGVPGELHIGGVGLARGYLNRPDLTAEKFIPDPFSTEPGARLYKTGDLARYLDDGNIEFLGRLDNQVKIRGFRIELGEIESALISHPAIREAVVIAQRNEFGEMRLVAYVVPSEFQLERQPPTLHVKDCKEEPEKIIGAINPELGSVRETSEEPHQLIMVSATQVLPSPRELRSYLKITLPDYMLPTAFVALQALPVTPNGKVDRKALSEPQTTSVTSVNRSNDQSAVNSRELRGKSSDVPNRDHSDLELRIAEVWRGVLHSDDFGFEDNFFEVGGDSLMVASVLERLGEAIGKQIPMTALFQYPTIRLLAEHLNSGPANPGISSAQRNAQRQAMALAQRRISVHPKKTR